MELTATQMFGIALLIFGAIGLVRVVRYFTLEESEKKRLQEKVDELTAKVKALEKPASRRPLYGKSLLHKENGQFLNVRQGDLIEDAKRLLCEALKYNVNVTEEFVALGEIDDD